MQNNKLKIIMLILIGIILILSIGGTIIYLTTDLMKSKDALFKKYTFQQVENTAKVFNVSKETSLVDWLQNNDYTETTEIKLKYIENQNDEEEQYILKQRSLVNNTDNTSYRRASIDYENENLMRLEMLKQNEIYGLRIANLVQQFASVENKNLSYFVSSMGYKGQYFSDKLQKVDLSGLLEFSDEEIKTLTNTYANLIFSDINSKSYSSKRNVIITLNNGNSVTANSYSVTLTQTQLDKINKKILNQAIHDEIILSKIKEIDNRIKEAGIQEPEGESLEERYISTLQEISNKIEYTGENNNKIIFTVYESKGTTIRTTMQNETKSYIVDLDNKSGIGMSLKTIELTENGEEVKIYSLGRANTEGVISTDIKYQDDKQTLNINFKAENQADGVNIETESSYSNEKINSLKLETTSVIKKGQPDQVAVQFEESNNILLNNYEGDRIESILKGLKRIVISSLNETQSKINTKLLNNLLIWIDNKEQTEVRQEEENIELKKQKFNNQFILYAGQELDDEHVKKLLNVASKNMTDYQIVNGNKIKILIKEGEQNEEKLNEIEAIVTKKYKYNIEINYSDDGWVDSIDISTFQKK